VATCPTTELWQEQACECRCLKLFDKEANLYSYAFEFLLLALDRLESLEWTCSCDPIAQCCDDYTCRMRYRIRRTCHGHLIWLYNVTEKPRHILCSHYWASGKILESIGKSDRLGEKSIMDIPFHIIKAADFCRIVSDQGIRKDIAKGFKSIFKYWIQDLHRDNKNNEYVFPRSMEKNCI
jgi:hypothetical protein